MARSAPGEGPFEARPPDSYVRDRVSDPSAIPEPTVSLVGLLGDSDRGGRRRLYFNTTLDYYADFASTDVVSYSTVPANEDPFRGLEATRVDLKRDARVEYTHAVSGSTHDAFQLAPRQTQSGLDVASHALGDTEMPCVPNTAQNFCTVLCSLLCTLRLPTAVYTDCRQNTCDNTCGATCESCQPTCGQTCVDTCAQTCNTCDGCTYAQTHCVTCRAGCN